MYGKDRHTITYRSLRNVTGSLLRAPLSRLACTGSYHCHFPAERPTFSLAGGRSLTPAKGGGEGVTNRRVPLAPQRGAASRPVRRMRASYIYKGSYPRRGRSVLARPGNRAVVIAIACHFSCVAFRPNRQHQHASRRR